MRTHQVPDSSSLVTLYHPNSLDNVVKGLDHGFGSHQQQLKSIISFAVQQRHRQFCLILHLDTG